MREVYDYRSKFVINSPQPVWYAQSARKDLFVEARHETASSRSKESHAANKQAGHNPKMVDSIGLHVDHVNHRAIPEIISVSSTGPVEIPSARITSHNSSFTNR
jgi:hypothetical protein